MSPDLIKVLLLLGAVVFMFVRNRPRTDVVALLAIAALPLLGIISAEDALAGFSDPNVILIALLFVVGEGLVRTGIAQRLGDMIVERAGHNEFRLIPLLMVAVAGVGSVMSSTGVVAIFIPVAIRIATRTGIAAGRLLMPLSVAALLSGMMTLIATPPNLVVQRALVEQGHHGFQFFAFSPFGIPLLALSIAWMLYARRWLGAPAKAKPARGARPRMAEWVKEYALGEREHRIRILPGSKLIGDSLAALDLRNETGINILFIERNDDHHLSPSHSTVLAEGDVLLIDAFSREFHAEEFAKNYSVEFLPLTGAYLAHVAHDLGMAELVVPAHSPLVGSSVLKSRFRSQYDLAVIGLKHGTNALSHGLLNEPLKAGSTLLVTGPWRAIRRLEGSQEDLVLLNLPFESESVAPAASRAPFALASLAVMVVLMVTGVVPNVLAALIGCLLMGATRCVDLSSAYRSIHWPTLILIVGMIPFAQALQHTGGVEWAAQTMQATLGQAGPHGMLAALFVLTAVLGLFISNTATAILVAPLALKLAAQAGLSPYPFAMTVALAASAAFMTPVSSPVNTLVAGPGNYRFTDFLRVGVPLALVTLLVTLVLVPWLLPFSR